MVFVNPYSDLRFGGPFSRGGGFFGSKKYIWTHSLEHEEMWPLNFTNITRHIEPILEQNHYCDDNVLNLKRHSGNMSFVRPLDLLRFSCNQ